MEIRLNLLEQKEIKDEFLSKIQFDFNKIFYYSHRNIISALVIFNIDIEIS